MTPDKDDSPRKRKRLTPYQKIVRAGQYGRGLKLTGKEIAELNMDDAILTVARNDDELDKQP